MSVPFRALTLFGANWDTPNTTGTFALSLPLNALMHLWWRVNELAMTYSFTDSGTGGSIGASVIIPKAWNVSPRVAATSHKELVGNWGYGVAPYYIDDGSIENRMGLFYNRIVPQDFAANQWRVPLLIQLSHETNAPGFSVESAQTFLGQPLAGSWNIHAVDPITSEVYDISGNMYVLGGSTDISGSVSITPYSYYSYDGKYNTVTGALN